MGCAEANMEAHGVNGDLRWIGIPWPLVNSEECGRHVKKSLGSRITGRFIHEADVFPGEM
jgi:hypothetical protein